MSAEIVQFVPRPRRARPVLGPLPPVVPNAIEEVFQRALTPSEPHEAAIEAEKEPAKEPAINVRPMGN